MAADGSNAPQDSGVLAHPTKGLSNFLGKQPQNKINLMQAHLQLERSFLYFK